MPWSESGFECRMDLTIGSSESPARIWCHDRPAGRSCESAFPGRAQRVHQFTHRVTPFATSAGTGAPTRLLQSREQFHALHRIEAEVEFEAGVGRDDRTGFCRGTDHLDSPVHVRLG